MSFTNRERRKGVVLWLLSSGDRVRSFRFACLVFLFGSSKDPRRLVGETIMGMDDQSDDSARGLRCVGVSAKIDEPLALSTKYLGTNIDTYA